MKKISLVLITLLFFACDKSNTEADDKTKINAGVEEINQQLVDDISGQLEDSEADLEEDMTLTFNQMSSGQLALSERPKVTKTEYDSTTGYHSRSRSWAFSSHDSIKHSRNGKDILIVRDLQLSGKSSIKARFSNGETHYEFPKQHVNDISKIEVKRDYNRSLDASITKYVGANEKSRYRYKSKDGTGNFESVLTRSSNDVNTWNMSHSGTRTIELELSRNDTTLSFNRSMSVSFENVMVKLVKKHRFRKRFAIISGTVKREIDFKSSNKLIIITEFFNCHEDKNENRRFVRKFYKNSVSKENLIKEVISYCK